MNSGEFIRNHLKVLVKMKLLNLVVKGKNMRLKDYVRKYCGFLNLKAATFLRLCFTSL